MGFIHRLETIAISLYVHIYLCVSISWSYLSSWVSLFSSYSVLSQLKVAISFINGGSSNCVLHVRRRRFPWQALPLQQVPQPFSTLVWFTLFHHHHHRHRYHHHHHRRHTPSHIDTHVINTCHMWSYITTYIYLSFLVSSSSWWSSSLIGTHNWIHLFLVDDKDYPYPAGAISSYQPPPPPPPPPPSPHHNHRHAYRVIIMLSYVILNLYSGIVATTTASSRSQLNSVIGARVKRGMQDMETLQRNLQEDLIVESWQTDPSTRVTKSSNMIGKRAPRRERTQVVCLLLGQRPAGTSFSRMSCVKRVTGVGVQKLFVCS